MSQAWAILAAPETTQDPQWTALIAIVCALLLGATILFFALEIPGLRRDKGPLTLSWSIRRWLGIYPKRREASALGRARVRCVGTTGHRVPRVVRLAHPDAGSG
jgi:hypothetical protein